MGELTADGIVHALGVTLGLAGAIAIMVMAALRLAPSQIAPIFIYAAGLVAMLGCSAAYNLLRSNRRRDLLRRFDHAAIFAMIAGTYTPFTTLRLDGAWAYGLTAGIWAVAGLGIAVKLWQPHRIQRLSIFLYLALGWIGVIAVQPFLTALGASTLMLLAIGGALYSVGVIFYVWRSLPYHTAVWHCFVLVAASVHYFAVLKGAVIVYAAS
jgi:hemolysin III